MKINHITFDELPEYQKDFKKLLKKYRTLPEDLRILKISLADEPDEAPPFSYRINDLHIETCVIKVKKIASKSFFGRGVNSGFRLVYAWFAPEQRIVLVELYHKNDKENEDRERILNNFK